jgi:hypothetical protein
MNKELGYEDRSYKAYGWYLLEKSIKINCIEEIRINLKDGSSRKSRLFGKNKMMWSAHITKGEHLVIHQKLIEQKELIKCQR